MKDQNIGAQEIYLAPETTEKTEPTVLNGVSAAEKEEILLEKEPNKISRVSELTDLRREKRRIFRMSDGTEQAVFYPETVYTRDAETGIFEAVDNTLAEEEDGRHFINRKERFAARFSREEENDELFSVKSGMYGVTVYAKKSLKLRNTGVKPLVEKKVTGGAVKTDVVRYCDVEAGADYEYSVQGSGVKEEIVIKEKSAVYRYPFIMKCENVIPELDGKNNRIAFKSAENGEEIFFIPAPFMTDANGISSGKAEYSMRTAADGNIHLTVNADSEWINAERRAFPVVIDPQIKLTSASDMTAYSWSNGYMSAQNAHKVGVVGAAAGSTAGGSCNTVSDNMAKAVPLSLDTWTNGTITCSGNEVWYKITTTHAGIYSFKTKGSTDTMGYLYNSGGCFITYNDDCCYERNFYITAALNANSVYYLAVKAYGTNTGSYSVYAALESITADSGSTPAVKGTRLNAGSWVSDVISCPNEEKWYTFRAEYGSGTYVISTRGSMDTVGCLYDSNNNQIAYNDDCNGLNFSISACLSGGAIYYLKVRAYSTKTGSYSVGVTPECCTSPEQPRVCYTPQRLYMTFNMPTLPRNPRIKKAMLKFYQKSGASDCGTQAKLGLYRVTGSIYPGSCTPAYNTDLIDFAEAKTESYVNGEITSYSFDITNLADELSKGETYSPRLMLKAVDESLCCQSYVELYGVSGSYAPEIVIDYESSYGVNTAYRAHTHELGVFGKGSIDLQCGNLMFESEDFAWGGNRMPVTIKHLYNSALANYRYTSNTGIGLNTASFSAMKIGSGFKLNLMQSMVRRGDEYVFIGENGAETYFKKSAECCGNGQCCCIYKENDGEAEYNPETRKLTQGEEIRTFDSAGRLVSVKDKYNKMQILYNTSGQITCVIDGAGREFAFGYSNGFLTSITAPDNSTVVYAYSGEKLTAVTYPDGRKAVIAYESSGVPSSVTLKDAANNEVYAVKYVFTGDKVYSVTEYGNGGTKCGSEGAKTVYSYSAASGRTVAQTYEKNDTSESGDCSETVIKTVYTFNDDGNIVSEYVYSEDSGNVSAKGEESGINPHSADGGAGVVSNINNLLLNHSFNGLSSWSGLSCNCGDIKISNYAYEPYAVFGKKLLRMQSTSQSCTENGVYQVTNTLPKGEYTFSAYMRVLSSFTGENAGAFIRVTKTNGEILAQSERLTRADSEYLRLAAPFTLETAQSVNVQILVNGKGTVYTDAAQLENNAYANAYNLLVNGNFELQSGWNTSGAFYSNGTRFNMKRALYMIGSLNYTRKAWQRVYVKSNRATRESFILSGWAKGYGLPSHEREGVTPTFRLRAVVKYYDTYYREYGTEEHIAEFSPCTEEWQLTSVEFAKSKYRTVEYIDIYIDYDHNFGTAYFDDIQLVRTGIETELTAVDFETEQENEKAENAGEAEAENTEGTDAGFKEKTDKYGNSLTETTFTDGEFGTIYRSFEFTPECNCAENAGNDLIKETDARGKTTEYKVDEDTSRNEEVTDRCGNKTAYEYNAAGKPVKVISKKPDNSEIASVSYTYDALDNMTGIVRGDGLKYTLEYNAFHKLGSIGIEGKGEKLISYAYKNGNGRLKEMTYANGDKMTATYNGLGHMTAEKWFNEGGNLTAYYKYIYDGQGNIVKTLDISACKEYNYLYDNGRLVQSSESNITFGENEFVVSKAFVCTVRYYYGAEDKLSSKRISYADGTERTVNYEQAENDSQVVRFVSGGKTVTSHSKTDSFGRKVFDELQTGAGFISRRFSYAEGEFTAEHAESGMLKSTPTTQLVSQIVLSGGRTISYEYDAEERITKVTDSETGVTEYTYDELGQLLTEKVNNTAVNTMTYDNYGNILTKNGAKYVYDAVWKDLLTSYNGNPIGYDTQGNPISYLGHTLTWEKGRQLKSFDGNAYTYNANGIRTSKTVGGIRHDYVLDGAKILREVWNGNTLTPLYDNEDGVCGIEYNGTAYYFLKNLQGDVIALTDSTGKAVAKYSYDAWGVCTVISDVSGCSIAVINPYRYRSYYYDAEIGMYYLQSRYYNPLVGRFINGDDAEIIDDTECDLHCNLFEYCKNNAVSMNDNSGFDPDYIRNQNSQPYRNMKLVRNMTVGRYGCGAVAVYNILHSYSRKVNFKKMIPILIHSSIVIGLPGFLNWAYNVFARNGVSIFSMIAYLMFKFFWVSYSFFNTYLWGIRAELSGGIIVAYYRKTDGGGHYVAGIKCGGGVGGRFRFYNSDWISSYKTMSIWQYIDLLKKKRAVPLAMIAVAGKKGWW